MSDYDVERNKRFRSAFPARSPEMAAKHRARAVERLASHRCVCDLTDGFCGPHDGTRCRRMGADKPGRSDCVKQAEGLMQAIEGVGCTVVWAFDREMRGPTPETGNCDLALLRQAIIDHTKGDGFWIGEILLTTLDRETGFRD